MVLLLWFVRWIQSSAWLRTNYSPLLRRDLPAYSIPCPVSYEFFSLANGNRHCWVSTRHCFLYSFHMFVFPGLKWFPHKYALCITQLSTLCRSLGFFCSTPSSPGSRPVISTCLCFTRPSASSPKSRSLVDSTSVPSSCFVAWKFSQGSELEHSLGSLHLFQESLPLLLEVHCLENKFLMCFVCFVLACFR